MLHEYSTNTHTPFSQVTWASARPYASHAGARHGCGQRSIGASTEAAAHVQQSLTSRQSSALRQGSSSGTPPVPLVPSKVSPSSLVVPEVGASSVGSAGPLESPPLPSVPAGPD